MWCFRTNPIKLDSIHCPEIQQKSNIWPCDNTFFYILSPDLSSTRIWKHYYVCSRVSPGYLCACLHPLRSVVSLLYSNRMFGDHFLLLYFVRLFRPGRSCPLQCSCVACNGVLSLWGGLLLPQTWIYLHTDEMEGVTKKNWSSVCIYLCNWFPLCQC